MLKKTVIMLCLVTAFVSVSVAQKVSEPAKGSAERTLILNVLRVPVEKELKQKVQFSVNTIKVSGNWVFVSGEPQTMSGEKPDYKGTEYQEAVDEQMFDNGIFALLKKTGGKWKIVKYMIGCTDVCYVDWSAKYKAPKAIFR